jgi:uncharacterized protein YdeI (YjbR/CyaY-like superfamily)
MAGEEDKPLYFADRDAWRVWLKENYLSEENVWLGYYKKHTGKPTVSYNDAVEEALCFGWIDGLVKSVDGERYKQRYTPRRAGSSWAKSNIKRVKKMRGEGKMTKEGLQKYQEGMAQQKAVPTVKEIPSLPPDLKRALSKNKKARENFDGFAPSYQLIYIHWVKGAKRADTRQRRIDKVVSLSSQGKKTFER